MHDKVSRMLASGTVKLDIGAGSHNGKTPYEEWLHVDFEPGDHVEIVADFGDVPMPDKSDGHIHIGDVIEHVKQYDYNRVLAEWNRIAKIGCIVTGATPNIDRVMRDYAAGKPDMPLIKALTNLYGWGDREGQIHYITFTKEMLTRLFGTFGFEVADFSESPGDPTLVKPWWLVFRGRKVSDDCTRISVLPMNFMTGSV